MTNKIKQSALGYAEAGVPVFPCNANKSPAVANGFHSASTDATWINSHFESAAMIGVPMGGIVCLDIDAKHKDGLVADFEFCCDQLGLTDLLITLPKQLTPSGGGAHYLFKPPSEVRNMKLAVNADRETIIETRGAGGYICVYPSKGYAFERGGLLDVPAITEQQMWDLFEVARSFSEVAVKTKIEPGDTPWKPKKDSAGDQPGDHYNQRGDIVALLQSHGWSTRNGSHWARPGKAHGVSATLGKVEGKFYVFSSNAHPFDSETSYSPFACYAILEHGGDFSAATAALRQDGYGGESQIEEVSAEFKASIAAMIAREVEKQEYSWAKMEADVRAAKEIIAEDAESMGSGAKFLASITAMIASTEDNISDMQQRAQDAVFVLPDIALKGDSTLINAGPNTGKTLLTLWLACRRPSVGGQEVFYINADDSFNGSIEKMLITKNSGIHTLIPNEKGFEPGNFAKICKSAIKDGAAGRMVFILDTLKKFVDTMSKGEAREFGIVVRAFTQAGGTVIALAHTNKSKAADGKSVAEGVGDFESDMDCAYTLEEVSGRHTSERHVMFTNRKNRGPNAQKVGFVYDDSEKKSWHKRFQSIKPIGAAEAKAKVETALAEQQFEKDQPIVAFLTAKLKLGPQSTSSLCQNDLGATGSGSRVKRERVLERYSSENPNPSLRIWGKSRNQTGGMNYYLLSDEGRPQVGNLVGMIG